MKALEVITEADRALVKAAIQKAERITSGEIRVFVEDRTSDEPLDRAAWLFGQLGMHETDARNGVLIYLAVVDRKFAVIGDYGIHEKVGEAFWNDVSNAMLEQLSTGKIAAGIVHAVDAAGQALSKYFPFQKNDTNELSDDIAFGE